jgi:hypothetical protein
MFRKLIFDAPLFTLKKEKFYMKKNNVWLVSFYISDNNGNTFATSTKKKLKALYRTSLTLFPI